MSPRAAWRLERLGFVTYDYTGGKADWLAAGLPTIRPPGGESRALDAADRKPATCQPDETVGLVAARADLGPVIVVTDTGVVLGLLTDEEFHDDPAANVEDSMRPAPTTVRAHEPLEPLHERMQKRNGEIVLVTTPEGVLLGALRHRGRSSVRGIHLT
jgi:CBS domain-containing protein